VTRDRDPKGACDTRAMPYTVPYTFDVFFETINLPSIYRTEANERRGRIVSYLEDRFEILDAFPSGSIPRYTALKGYSDLDIIVVLHFGKHIKGRAPSAVLKDLRDELDRYHDATVRRNGQAVTMHFQDWPKVDVVPAKKFTSNDKAVAYGIPDMHLEQWIRSRPHTHSKRMADEASQQGAGFKRIVKMLKEWNRVHGAPLQSFHLEVLALKALNVTSFDYDQDHTWPLFQFFEKATPLVREYLWYDDCWADDYLDLGDRDALVRLFEETTELAARAWSYTYENDKDEDEQAIGAWKTIFGPRFPAYG
jgi:hypothetical protein